MLISIVVVAGVWFRVYALNSQIDDLTTQLEASKMATYICENAIASQNEKIKKIELEKLKFSEPKVITQIKYLKPKDDNCSSRLEAYERLFEFGGKE
ncbi:Hypothetical protein CFV354_0583 [Campylobacter fetus subsp. venerealis NCTC 10354]|nr:Hypothetical protein CFV354_0583 [Campylobacter fetus subsp. venerealis NCTC 10354]